MSSAKESKEPPSTPHFLMLHLYRCFTTESWTTELTAYMKKHREQFSKTTILHLKMLLLKITFSGSMGKICKILLKEIFRRDYFIFYWQIFFINSYFCAYPVRNWIKCKFEIIHKVRYGIETPTLFCWFKIIEQLTSWFQRVPCFYWV